MDILTLVAQWLLIILLIIQIITTIYLLYINIKRYKADKKFWKEMNEAMKSTIERYNYLTLGDGEYEREQDQNQS